MVLVDRVHLSQFTRYVGTFKFALCILRGYQEGGPPEVCVEVLVESPSDSPSGGLKFAEPAYVTVLASRVLVELGLQQHVRWDDDGDGFWLSEQGVALLTNEPGGVVPEVVNEVAEDSESVDIHVPVQGRAKRRVNLMMGMRAMRSRGQ